MPVVLIPALYGVAAFLLALLYHLVRRRPWLRALHWSAIFGLFVLMMVSISAFMFGVPDLSPDLENS